MGTATWSTLPTDQTILLHINDPAVCSSLYGSTSPYTCYVKPGSLAAVCDDGDDTVAYNAMPFGVVHCSKGTVAFEANAINELGDEVALAGTARKITSLNVEFNSFGCSVSGHWNTGDCVTNPGDTFTIPITATIYIGDTTTTGGVAPGSKIVAVTQNQTIHFRPSASASCTGTDAGKWFDPLLNGVGGCVNSLSEVLTFTFAGTTIPNNVVWTVAFNTSHSGYNPILCANPECAGGTLNPSPPTCSSSPAGCGYDSLNVGVQSYTGAPYAGTDVDEDIAFISFWTPSYPPPFSSGTLQSLESETGFTGFRPLGEIITTP